MLSVFGAAYGHTWVLAALQLVPQQARAAAAVLLPKQCLLTGAASARTHPAYASHAFALPGKS